MKMKLKVKYTKEGVPGVRSRLKQEAGLVGSSVLRIQFQGQLCLSCARF